MKTINEVSQGISALIEDLLEIKESGLSDDQYVRVEAIEAFLEYAIDKADEFEAAKAKAH